MRAYIIVIHFFDYIECGYLFYAFDAVLETACPDAVKMIGSSSILQKGDAWPRRNFRKSNIPFENRLFIHIQIVVRSFVPRVPRLIWDASAYATLMSHQFELFILRTMPKVRSRTPAAPSAATGHQSWPVCGIVGGVGGVGGGTCSL